MITNKSGTRLTHFAFPLHHAQDDSESVWFHFKNKPHSFVLHIHVGNCITGSKLYSSKRKGVPAIPGMAKSPPGSVNSEGEIPKPVICTLQRVKWKAER